MQKFTVQLPRPYLAAVTRFAAKNDIRYYLNGILVEVYANVAYLVATDGHTLALARIERNGENMGGQGSAILPREMVEKIKAKGNHGLDVVLSVDIAGQCTLNDCGTKTTAGMIDGKFPDWRRVIPRKVSGEVQFLQPDYLARTKKAAEDLGSKDGFFSLGFNGTGAALAEFPGHPVLAVIMPMRGESCESAPEWVDEKPESVGRLSEGEAIADHYCPDRVTGISSAHAQAIAEDTERTLAEEMAAEYGPIAYVSPAIAAAFGMEGIPNVRIMAEPERLAA